MRNAKHEAATSVVVEFGRRKGQKRSRVEAVDWVDAGLEFLRTESIEHVKVERLAARLGISKGSFYWHFRNKADLHAAILERWKKNLFNEVIDTIEREAATASERLRKLLELSFWSANVPRAAQLDLAVRAWARRYAPAQEAVNRFDAVRIEYVRNLFEEMEFNPQEAEARAHVAYPFIRYLNQSANMKETEKRRIIELGHECLTAHKPNQFKRTRNRAIRVVKGKAS
jgi:AcrR family transcriptional regulator